NLTNVANNGETINDTLLVKLTDLEAINCNISKTSSSNTFSVSYKNDDSVTPKIKIKSYTIQSENDSSTWISCDEDGNAFAPIEKNIKTASDTQTINLYAKQTEFSFPTITGRLKYNNDTSVTGDIGTIADDNIKIILYAATTGSDIKLGEAVTETRVIADTKVQHGVFTITPDSSYKWYNSSYTGKYAGLTDYTLKLKIEKRNDKTIDTSSYTNQQTTINLAELDATT
ncbi:MAG: hypothetical protein PUC01_07550, partial [Spirochaetales bacterium]|nr:hypothetical protein [Spirochaetales bacterium]